MKFFDGLKYTIICLVIFLVLTGLEVLLINALLDIFTSSFWVRFGVIMFFILIVNTIATYYLSNLLWNKIDTRN